MCYLEGKVLDACDRATKGDLVELSAFEGLGGDDADFVGDDDVEEAGVLETLVADGDELAGEGDVLQGRCSP